jgi:hypothetical protein
MTAIRRTGAASAAVLSGLALTLGVAQAAVPQWIHEAGLDVWNISRYRDALRASAEESARLQEETELLRQSIESLDHVTMRLAAGMIPLDEATNESEPLLRDRPGFQTTAIVYYSAPTLRLSIARYLIQRVESPLQSNPSQLAIVSRKLEAEYAEMNRP